MATPEAIPQTIEPVWRTGKAEATGPDLYALGNEEVTLRCGQSARLDGAWRGAMFNNSVSEPVPRHLADRIVLTSGPEFWIREDHPDREPELPRAVVPKPRRQTPALTKVLVAVEWSGDLGEYVARTTIGSKVYSAAGRDWDLAVDRVVSAATETLDGKASIAAAATRQQALDVLDGLLPALHAALGDKGVAPEAEAGTLEHAELAKAMVQELRWRYGTALHDLHEGGRHSEGISGMLMSLLLAACRLAPPEFAGSLDGLPKARAVALTVDMLLGLPLPKPVEGQGQIAEAGPGLLELLTIPAPAKDEVKVTAPAPMQAPPAPPSPPASLLEVLQGTPTTPPASVQPVGPGKEAPNVEMGGGPAGDAGVVAGDGGSGQPDDQRPSPSDAEGRGPGQGDGGVQGPDREPTA